MAPFEVAYPGCWRWARRVGSADRSPCRRGSHLGHVPPPQWWLVRGFPGLTTGIECSQRLAPTSSHRAKGPGWCWMDFLAGRQLRPLQRRSAIQTSTVALIRPGVNRELPTLHSAGCRAQGSAGLRVRASQRIAMLGLTALMDRHERAPESRSQCRRVIEQLGHTGDKERGNGEDVGQRRPDEPRTSP